MYTTRAEDIWTHRAKSSDEEMLSEIQTQFCVVPSVRVGLMDETISDYTFLPFWNFWCNIILGFWG